MSLEPPSKVNIRWQCVFAFIPIINFWASFRIRKLRKYLLLYIALTGVNIVVSFFIPFPYDVPISLAIVIPVMIHYMRKWSIQWNQSLEHWINPISIIIHIKPKNSFLCSEADVSSRDANDNSIECLRGRSEPSIKFDNSSQSTPVEWINRYIM